MLIHNLERMKNCKNDELQKQMYGLSLKGDYDLNVPLKTEVIYAKGRG